jgi:integrase
VIGMAAEYAAPAGNRKVGFIDLMWPQIDEKTEIIRVKRAKQRGEKIEHVEITPAITEPISRLCAAREDDCPYVSSNRYGTHFTPQGFKPIEAKRMSDAIEKKVIACRFTFHDMRACYVTRHNAERGAFRTLTPIRRRLRAHDRTKIAKRKGM